MSPNRIPIFQKKSLFKLGLKVKEFDVSFSNGVLEHFSDQKIILAIKQQLKIAQVVIISVPTKYFSQSEALYGDERYLPLDHWRLLINNSGGKILEEKSMHYKKTLSRLFQVGKYFKPYPYRIFVVSKVG